MEAKNTKIEVSIERLRNQYSTQELNKIEEAINLALKLVLGGNVDKGEVNLRV